MFFFFYGSLKSSGDAWKDLGLIQNQVTECLDPEALVHGRLFLQQQAEDGNTYPALQYLPAGRHLIPGELHRLREQAPVTSADLLLLLNQLEDYRPGDPASRYRPQIVELYQPRVQALTWVWQQSIEALEEIYSWPAASI